MSLADVAKRTGCPVRFLVGVRAVESGGDPKAIRFEPHLFKRHMPDMVVTIPRNMVPASAVKMRVAIRDEGKVPYTPGRTRSGANRSASSIASETDKAAFEFAEKIHAANAVISTSWGAYQQLGSSFSHVIGQPITTSYAAALATQAFKSNPVKVSDQLLAAWLLDNPKALAAAKEGNVEEFVRRYNGGPNPGYCTRMRAAFAEFDAGKLLP